MRVRDDRIDVGLDVAHAYRVGLHGVEIEVGETLDYLCGHFRMFQYEKGHRFSGDDLLTGWFGTRWCPRPERIADLGSGIGSVGTVGNVRLYPDQLVIEVFSKKKYAFARQMVGKLFGTLVQFQKESMVDLA